MLKLTKKADYGLIAVKHLAECGDPSSCSAKDIADAYGIPQAALAKILQKLVKNNLLVSHHGTKGGYALARSAAKISVLEVIKAIDGPLLMTSCGDATHGCYQSVKCTVREPLRKKAIPQTGQEGNANHKENKMPSRFPNSINEWKMEIHVG